MEKRNLLILCALIGMLATVWAGNDFIVGTHRPGAVLLQRTVHTMPGIAGRVVSQNYKFSTPVRNITLFQAFDLFTNGTGGFASIVDGGVGRRNVTYGLRASALGRGFSFRIDIYGL